MVIREFNFFSDHMNIPKFRKLSSFYLFDIALHNQQQIIKFKRI